MITVDVANAYHQNMVDFIKKVRDEYPTKIIVAGNVVTPEMTEELIINGNIALCEHVIKERQLHNMQQADN